MVIAHAHNCIYQISDNDVKNHYIMYAIFYRVGTSNAYPCLFTKCVIIYRYDGH